MISPNQYAWRRGSAATGTIVAQVFLAVLLAAATARAGEPDTSMIDIDGADASPSPDRADGEPERAPEPERESAPEPEPEPGAVEAANEAPQPVDLESGRPPPVEAPSEPDTTKDWRRSGHPSFGFYITQGVGWGQWQYKSTTVSTLGYYLDGGLGVQGKVLGGYFSAAGLLGGKVHDGAVTANYGRIAGLLRVSARRVFNLMFGIGYSFSELSEAVSTDPYFHDAGLAVPLKMSFDLPLKRFWAVGLGVSYDFNFMTTELVDSDYFVHIVALQLSVARW
jgi:hypothetical protein